MSVFHRQYFWWMGIFFFLLLIFDFTPLPPIIACGASFEYIGHRQQLWKVSTSFYSCPKWSASASFYFEGFSSFTTLPLLFPTTTLSCHSSLLTYHGTNHHYPAMLPQSWCKKRYALGRMYVCQKPILQNSQKSPFRRRKRENQNCISGWRAPKIRLGWLFVDTIVWRKSLDHCGRRIRVNTLYDHRITHSHTWGVLVYYTHKFPHYRFHPLQHTHAHTHKAQCKTTDEPKNGSVGVMISNDGCLQDDEISICRSLSSAHHM